MYGKIISMHTTEHTLENTALKYTLLKKEIIIKSILCFFDINRSTT